MNKAEQQIYLAAICDFTNGFRATRENKHVMVSGRPYYVEALADMYGGTTGEYGSNRYTWNLELEERENLIAVVLKGKVHLMPPDDLVHVADRIHAKIEGD